MGQRTALHFGQTPTVAPMAQAAKIPAFGRPYWHDGSRRKAVETPMGFCLWAQSSQTLTCYDKALRTVRSGAQENASCLAAAEKKFITAPRLDCLPEPLAKVAVHMQHCVPRKAGKTRQRQAFVVIISIIFWCSGHFNCHRGNGSVASYC